MPDINHRDKLERSFTRRVARVNGEAQALLLEALGDPPDASKLTQALWQDLQARYSGALLIELEQVFLAGAEALANQAQVGFDFTLVNSRAAEWARTHAATTATQIILNTGKRTLPIVEDYYRSNMTLADMTRRLEPLFGVGYAETIAITEITRASVEGERAYVAGLEPKGVILYPVHQTSNDSKVCPFCGPRDGETITDGRFPPLHPRCRCWVNWLVRAAIRSLNLPNSATRQLPMLARLR